LARVADVGLGLDQGAVGSKYRAPSGLHLHSHHRQAVALGSGNPRHPQGI